MVRVEVGVDLAMAVGVVAERDHVDSRREQLVGDLRRDAHAAGRVLAVDDDEVGRKAARAGRQQRQQRPLADPADDVADEQDADARLVHAVSERILPPACVGGFLAAKGRAADEDAQPERVDYHKREERPDDGSAAVAPASPTRTTLSSLPPEAKAQRPARDRVRDGRNDGTQGDTCPTPPRREQPRGPSYELGPRPPPSVIVPRWIQLVVLPIALLGLWALARASGPVMLILIAASTVALIFNPVVRVIARAGAARARDPRGLPGRVRGPRRYRGAGQPDQQQVTRFESDVPHLVRQANKDLTNLQ